MSQENQSRIDHVNKIYRNRAYAISKNVGKFIIDMAFLIDVYEKIKILNEGPDKNYHLLSEQLMYATKVISSCHRYLEDDYFYIKPEIEWDVETYTEDIPEEFNCTLINIDENS